MRRQARSDSGVAFLLVVLLGLALLALAAVSVDMVLRHGVAQAVERQAFSAMQIADSAAAQALGRIKEGGIMAPVSGNTATPSWVSFGDGEYFYYTTYDVSGGVSTIRAWGRVVSQAPASTSTVAPDSVTWNGTGWLVRGVEVNIRSTRYIPTSPMYFGNGGVEKPLGGFEWGTGVDPANPATWQTVVSGPASAQTSTVPFKASALDHPIDYIDNGGTPGAATAFPYPYSIWTSQNPIGQFNVQAWFKNSAGSTADPTSNLTPSPTSSYYDMSDTTSESYAYPVDSNVPDVQTFAHELWYKYGSSSAATKLAGGSHDGTYGDLTTPKVTFVTGALKVDAGKTFKGSGILVIRDDYDPNTQTNNQPSVKAGLDIRGTFQWTGLVIIAGWSPAVDVTADTGANATIVGSFFGEDSVQSGGEISLDSATIQLNVKNPFRVLYSNGLFRPGGLIHDFLPMVNKEVIGTREI